MKKFALIGKGLSHSYSPAIHKEIGKIFNLNLDYTLLDIEEEQLEETIDKLRTGEYHGYNVTMPYKMAVIPYLDKVMPNAQRMGSINTIYYKDGLVIGDNTDYYGFKSLVELSKETIKEKKVFILGSGGAAKSAYVALNDLGADVTVVKLKEAAEDPLFKKTISYDKLDKDKVDIFVNTTPLGMYPKIENAVLDQEMVEGKVVFDVIYNPEKTKFMSYAKRAYGGLLMLVIQAFYTESFFWDNENIKYEASFLERLRKVIYE